MFIESGDILQDKSAKSAPSLLSQAENLTFEETRVPGEH